MAYTCDSTGVKLIISAVEKGGVMAMPTPPGDFPRRAIAEPFTAGLSRGPMGVLPGLYRSAPQGGAHENRNDPYGSTTTVPAAGAPIARRATDYVLRYHRWCHRSLRDSMVSFLRSGIALHGLAQDGGDAHAPALGFVP